MGDRITYDDEGNPVVLKQRPPKPGKARHSFSGQSKNSEICTTPTEQKNHNNFRARASFSGTTNFADYEVNGRLTAIYEIEGKSHDVILEESKLSWTPVCGSGSKAKGKQAF